MLFFNKGETMACFSRVGTAPIFKDRFTILVISGANVSTFFFINLAGQMSFGELDGLSLDIILDISATEVDANELKAGGALIGAGGSKSSGKILSWL